MSLEIAMVTLSVSSAYFACLCLFCSLRAPTLYVAVVTNMNFRLKIPIIILKEKFMRINKRIT